MSDNSAYDYDLCDKHEWVGFGECPGCKAEKLANESIDRILTEQVRAALKEQGGAGAAIRKITMRPQEER